MSTMEAKNLVGLREIVLEPALFEISAPAAVLSHAIQELTETNRAIQEVRIGTVREQQAESRPVPIIQERPLDRISAIIDRVVTYFGWSTPVAPDPKLAEQAKCPDPAAELIHRARQLVSTLRQQHFQVPSTSWHDVESKLRAQTPETAKPEELFQFLTDRAGLRVKVASLTTTEVRQLAESLRVAVEQNQIEFVTDWGDNNFVLEDKNRIITSIQNAEARLIRERETAEIIRTELTQIRTPRDGSNEESRQNLHSSCHRFVEALIRRADLGDVPPRVLAAGDPSRLDGILTKLMVDGEIPSVYMVQSKDILATIPVAIQHLGWSLRSDYHQVFRLAEHRGYYQNEPSSIGERAIKQYPTYETATNFLNNLVSKVGRWADWYPGESQRTQVVPPQVSPANILDLLKELRSDRSAAEIRAMAERPFGFQPSEHDRRARDFDRDLALGNEARAGLVVLGYGLGQAHQETIDRIKNRDRVSSTTQLLRLGLDSLGLSDDLDLARVTYRGRLLLEETLNAALLKSDRLATYIDSSGQCQLLPNFRLRLGN